MPEISVIVPIYKVEQYLHQCVNSILAQTFTNFELILVDDGSPDNCGEICDAYAKQDSRIYIIHKKNGGVSSARNAALEVVQGRYLTFCDSDDSYDPKWLEELYFAIITNVADMVVGNYCKCTLDGPEKEKSNHEVGVYNTEDKKERISYCVDKIFGHKHGWEVWTRLFRSDIIRENRIRFCETCENFAEDLGFVLEYALYAKRIVSVDANGYNYLARSGSMMNICAGIFKLNAANEVSLYFADRYSKIFFEKTELKVLPIFHFLIMANEYQKVIWNNQYNLLYEKLKDIHQFEKWKSNTKRIFACKKELCYFFGEFTAKRILLLTHYCLHGNWKRFTIESALFYRFNKPNE